MNDQKAGFPGRGELNVEPRVGSKFRRPDREAFESQLPEARRSRGRVNEVDDAETVDGVLTTRVRQILEERGGVVPAVDDELSKGKQQDGQRNEGRPDYHFAGSLRKSP